MHDYSSEVEYAEYPLMSLLGDIGGQLGLFLGASILTVVEFVDLWLRICWKKVKQKNTKERSEVNNKK